MLAVVGAVLFGLANFAVVSKLVAIPGGAFALVGLVLAVWPVDDRPPEGGPPDVELGKGTWGF